MLISETQVKSLASLSEEITKTLTSRTYGYLLLSETEGDCRTFFSANVCKYSLEDASSLYSIIESSTLYESSRNDSGIVLAFEPERETKHESKHPFRTIPCSNSMIFVDPELARLLDPRVDLNNELLRLYEKLKKYPFYLQLALVWYCNCLGIEYQTPVLDTVPSCIIYGDEYYKKVVESNLYTEWVNTALEAITAAL